MSPKQSLVEKAQRRIDRTAKSTDQNVFFERVERKLNTKKIFYYVFGFTKAGRKFFDGPMEPDEADRILTTLDDGEIFESLSYDQTKAMREFKAMILSRDKKPDEALERVTHKLPERSKR